MKAYAKIHCNFEVLDGGSSEEALFDFTAAPCVVKDISDNKETNDIIWGTLTFKYLSKECYIYFTFKNDQKETSTDGFISNR
jgi:hypothetical protein